MKQLKSNPFFYLSLVLAVLVILEAVSLVNAQWNWTPPSQQFPYGNRPPPLDTGPNAQYKAGALGVGTGASQSVRMELFNNSVPWLRFDDAGYSASIRLNPTSASNQGGLWLYDVSNPTGIKLGGGGGGGGGGDFWKFDSSVSGIKYASTTNPNVVITNVNLSSVTYNAWQSTSTDPVVDTLPGGSWRDTSGQGNTNESCVQWLTRTNQLGSERRVLQSSGAVISGQCVYLNVSDNSYHNASENLTDVNLKPVSSNPNPNGGKTQYYSQTTYKNLDCDTSDDFDCPDEWTGGPPASLGDDGYDTGCKSWQADEFGGRYCVQLVFKLYKYRSLTKPANPNNTAKLTVGDIDVAGDVYKNSKPIRALSGTICGWRGKNSLVAACDGIDPLYACPAGYTRARIGKDLWGGDDALVCIKL